MTSKSVRFCSQNGTKIGPKMVSEMVLNLLLFLGWFWCPNWPQKWPQNGSKIGPKMGSAAQMCSWSPKRGQNGLNMAPGVPKWTQNGSKMAPKWLQNVTLEPEMDTKMEPTRLQGLPRGASGAPSGANMHPKWDARGNELRSFCVSPHRHGPRPGGMREAIKLAEVAHGVAS